MTKYVALLRGINVGGNNKVSMQTLRTVFEGLGYVNVSTYINSGNVLFESSKVPATLVREIEKGIAKMFGFPVRVVVRDRGTIRKVIKAIPPEWSNDAKWRTDVLFLWEKFDDKKTLKLIAQNPRADTLKYSSGAIAWRVDRALYTKSGLRTFIGTEVYKHMTARNINTVRKLAELMG